MLMLPATLRVLLYREPVDMRGSFDGLECLARDGLGEDPLSGASAEGAYWLRDAPGPPRAKPCGPLAHFWTSGAPRSRSKAACTASDPSSRHFRYTDDAHDVDEKLPIRTWRPALHLGLLAASSTFTRPMSLISTLELRCLRHGNLPPSKCRREWETSSPGPVKKHWSLEGCG